MARLIRSTCYIVRGLSECAASDDGIMSLTEPWRMFQMHRTPSRMFTVAEVYPDA